MIGCHKIGTGRLFSQKQILGVLINSTFHGKVDSMENLSSFPNTCEYIAQIILNAQVLLLNFNRVQYSNI